MLTLWQSRIRHDRLRMEKFVYVKGTNVALYNVEHSSEYQKIKKGLENVLFEQINNIASREPAINTLLMFTKAASEELIRQVGSFFAVQLLREKIDFPSFLIWAGTQGGQAALDKLEIDGVFDLKNPAFIRFFDNHTNLLIDSVNDTTKKWIANRIQEGKDKGLTTLQIADILQSEGRGFSAVRAEMIVLTETQNAMVTVELETAKRSGVKDKIWRTSIDDRVCPICLPLEGVQVGVNEVFDSEVGPLEGPSAHPRCRCYLEWVTASNWEQPQQVWLGA